MTAYMCIYVYVHIIYRYSALDGAPYSENDLNTISRMYELNFKHELLLKLEGNHILIFIYDNVLIYIYIYKFMNICIRACTCIRIISTPYLEFTN
jgi:hypothetical protein